MYRINPNKTAAGEIYDHSLFEGVLRYIIDDMELSSSECYINRIDFRADSFIGHYEDHLKLNLLLLLLIDYTWKRHNRYESHDFLTLDSLTLRIQSKRLEVEYYNKREQAPAGRVETRLELRSKALTGDLTIPELAQDWCRRLGQAPKFYDALLKKQNQFLAHRYCNENNLVKGPWEFARRHEGNIFSRKQLSELFDSLGISNASKSADNFFNKNRNVQKVSQRDVEHYAQRIASELQDYLLR